MCVLTFQQGLEGDLLPFLQTHFVQVGQVVGSTLLLRLLRVWLDSPGAVDVLQVALHHDALANVTQCVGNLSGRSVAAEDVAHVLPCGSVPGHISKVPEEIKASALKESFSPQSSIGKICIYIMRTLGAKWIITECQFFVHLQGMLSSKEKEYNTEGENSG